MQEVNLQTILDAKERLADIQNEMRRKNGLPVISITANMPGKEKTNPAVISLVRYAVDQMRIMAELKGFTIAEEKLLYPLTGPVAVMAVSADPVLLKQLGVEIENTAAYGRLLDIDVFDAAGRQISRRDLGLPPRGCLVCEQTAIDCMRLRRHGANELKEAVTKRFYRFAAQKANPWPEPVWDIGAWALEAMLMEAASTPAPGLVDRLNAGAHHDMDYFTFLKSSSALSGTMLRCVAAGWHHEGTPQELLPVLRHIGMDGERRMFRATNNINTQRGLVFILGILAAAAMHVLRKNKWEGAAGVLCQISEICQGMVARELEPLRYMQPARQLTAGEKAFLQYGVTGIRGEMEGGLPSVQHQGLPSLRTALASGLSLNDALVHTLMGLMTEVEDTTILNRHDWDVLTDVQDHAKKIMAAGGMLTETGRHQIHALDKRFIERNISPGGVADLVAATYFLHLLDARLHC